jgi:hypothetical protein
MDDADDLGRIARVDTTCVLVTIIESQRGQGHLEEKIIPVDRGLRDVMTADDDDDLVNADNA